MKEGSWEEKEKNNRIINEIYISISLFFEMFLGRIALN